jgi:hypothetical protein
MKNRAPGRRISQFSHITMQLNRFCNLFPRMFRPSALALALSSGLSLAADPSVPETPTHWPAAASQNKPWTRWWWLGSGVDKVNLTRELEAFAKAGIGGVEICPIYGAMGAEDRFIDFLSPQWMEMLAHTTREAQRLGLGVDMTTGTGWPFGGPMVTPDMASRGLQRISKSVSGGNRVSLKLPDGTLHALRAFPESGSAVDLTDQVKSGTLIWKAPAGRWTIQGVASRSQIQKVKRAAPGGAGHVLDPFSPDALNQYAKSFDQAFAGYSAPMPRAQFHDSFEYYGAAWTPRMFDAFKTARGYDLRDQLPAFNGVGEPDAVARVRADYRETLGELHRTYLKSWHDWTRKHGGVTRNQAHGSPGNLLDHYAVSEIPETEIFRHVGEEQIPMLRFAASAAHSNSGTLVSSESFTWLGEHFQVTPEMLKEAADFVFLGGVNHLFFHGIPYSPVDASWPGWLFYASTHMGPNGGLWHDLPAFNGYLQRCQSILQEGKPTSDVLLYFPFHDGIHDGAEKLPLFTIHNQDTWLHSTPFYRTAMEMWNHGITFDFTSDDMMSRAIVRDGRIILGNNEFKALVIPGVKRLPLETLEHIVRITHDGGRVIFQDGIPGDVPGFSDLENRRKTSGALTEKAKGKSIEVSGSILPALAEQSVRRESMAGSGLRFVRRSHAEGFNYFIVNRSGKDFDAGLTLAADYQSALVLDPWHPEKAGVVTNKAIPLRLAPLQSVVIRTFTHKKVSATPWSLAAAAPSATPLDGPWKLEFTAGGPVLPKSAELASPVSWTTLEDPAALNFSGTAKYSTAFDFSGSIDATTRLDLGKVAHTARIYLNGEPAGSSWCPPHLVDLTGKLNAGRNTLDIEVTNLAANRIADLDRRKIPWKQFHEINFVNIDYKNFDASSWPALESGLIGPVRLLIDANP